jgi:hypothetical protein
MPDDLLAQLLPVAVAMLGGGGAVAAWIQARHSHRVGVRQRHIESEQNALSGFRDLALSLREEIGRLRVEAAEDRARIDAIEAEIAAERDLRRSAIRHIRHLYAWIAEHLPGVRPPRVPAELAELVRLENDDENTTDGNLR